MECRKDVVIDQKFIEREGIFDFLAGLNVELDQVRLQVLRKATQTSLREVFTIIREEIWRNVMLGNTTFALAISMLNHNEGIVVASIATN